eukprot:scaffold1516_cov230-Pinguiococcus_pyrenoidosus.AAC.18
MAPRGRRLLAPSQHRDHHLQDAHQHRHHAADARHVGRAPKQRELRAVRYGVHKAARGESCTEAAKRQSGKAAQPCQLPFRSPRCTQNTAKQQFPDKRQSKAGTHAPHAPRASLAWREGFFVAKTPAQMSTRPKGTFSLSFA